MESGTSAVRLLKYHREEAILDAQDADSIKNINSCGSLYNELLKREAIQNKEGYTIDKSEDELQHKETLILIESLGDRNRYMSLVNDHKIHQKRHNSLVDKYNLELDNINIQKKYIKDNCFNRIYSSKALSQACVNSENHPYCSRFKW